MPLSTEAFNAFVPPTQYKRSLRRVAEELDTLPEMVVTDEYAPDLIRLAQAGNHDALMVLYRRSRQAIAYIFWKNFIGPNKRYVGRRLDRGDDDLFAAEAWDTMEKALTSFDPDKYDTADTVNFLGKWHYWFQQYLKATAIRLNKEIERQGFTGVGDSAGLHVDPMPEDPEHPDRGAISLSEPGLEREMEVEDALQSFIQDLRADIDTNRRKRILHDILTMRLEGQDIDTIADQLGTTAWNIRKYMRDLKGEMQRYGIFESRQALDAIRELQILSRFILLDEAAGASMVPKWQPLSDLNVNQALRFRKRKLSDMVTHHISPAYLIVETTLPNRRPFYTIYFRLPPPKGTTIRPELEYANHVDLLVSNHRTPRVKSMSMAKQLIRQHFHSRGEAVKTGIDPASPHAWLHAL